MNLKSNVVSLEGKVNSFKKTQRKQRRDNEEKIYIVVDQNNHLQLKYI